VQSLDPLKVAAVTLGAVLIGVGILLVVAAFIITYVVSHRPVPPGPAPTAGFFDFMIELAKRIELVYVPGFLMIGLGIFLVGIVVVGAGPFTGGTDASPAPSVLPLPTST
jgi:hypothetical protein